jgi:DNA-binding GntR family transcriptional regulator
MPSTQTWGLTAVERRSITDHVPAELRAAIISGRIGPSEPLRETAFARTLAAEAQMFMHHQPIYPPVDYAADHSLLFDAIAQRRPDAADLVRDHLRLSAKLIAGEMARQVEADDAGATPVDIMAVPLGSL